MTHAYRTRVPSRGLASGLLSTRVLGTLHRPRAGGGSAAAVRGEEKVRLEIVSLTAAKAGGEHGITWRGELSVAFLALFRVPGVPFDREGMNAAILRFFNRVNDADDARLRSVGYHLPSLSLGDLVAIDRITFLVARERFERVTGNPGFTYPPEQTPRR